MGGLVETREGLTRPQATPMAALGVHLFLLSAPEGAEDPNWVLSFPRDPVPPEGDNPEGVKG